MISNMKKNIGLVVAGFTLAIFVGLAQNIFNAVKAQATDGMSSQALLAEVKALRQALQSFTIGNARMQLSIEKLRVQEMTVERLTQNLYRIQDQLDNERAALISIEQNAKALERSANSDPTQAREAQNMLVLVDEAKQRISRLQQREAEISQALNVEKSRSQELKDALDLLAK